MSFFRPAPKDNLVATRVEQSWTRIESEGKPCCHPSLNKLNSRIKSKGKHFERRRDTMIKYTYLKHSYKYQWYHPTKYIHTYTSSYSHVPNADKLVH